MGRTPSPEYSGADKNILSTLSMVPNMCKSLNPFWIFSGNDGDDIGRIWLLVIKHGSWKSPRFHGAFKGKVSSNYMEARWCPSSESRSW
jgi:hypothetical protein